MGKGGDGGAGAQAAAARDAAQISADTQKYVFDQTRQDFSPYRALGDFALPQLQALAGQTGQTVDQLSGIQQQMAAMNPNISVGYNDIQGDPMFQIARDQALTQNARRARAMGLGNSSVRGEWDSNSAINAALQARDRIYGEREANWGRGYNQLLDQSKMTAGLGDLPFNRYLQLGQMGQAAAGQTAGAGRNYANSITNIQSNLAQGLGNAAATGAQAKSDQMNTLGALGGMLGKGAATAFLPQLGSFAGPLGTVGGALLGSLFA